MKTIDIILKAVGNIEGEVKGIRIEMKKMNGTLISHDKRINTNESKIDVNMGKVSVISALFGFIGACVIAFIGFFGK